MVDYVDRSAVPLRQHPGVIQVSLHFTVNVSVAALCAATQVGTVKPLSPCRSTQKPLNYLQELIVVLLKDIRVM
jgi:hypothetical protein